MQPSTEKKNHVGPNWTITTMIMIVYTKMSFCFYANRSRWHRSVNDFMIRKAR